MIRIVIAAIIAIAAVFLALAALIVAGKAWREVRDGWRRVRRRALEPGILAWVHGDEPSVIASVGGGLRARDRIVVETILLDHAQLVRGIERERLGRALDEFGYVDRWLAGLRSSRWWTRASCAEKLGLAAATRAAPALAAALDDEEGEVRLRAAKSLGAVGGVAAVPPLIRALAEQSRWSTIRIADILTEVGPRVPRELAASFSALPPHAKRAALDVCGRIKEIDTVPWLIERLLDPDRDIRARAAHALGQIGHPDSGPALARLLRDADWPVRAMAAKALGRTRWESAVPSLCSVLRDREWWVRANAAEALRLIGPSGLDALERVLDDQDVFARHQAVVMLQESGRLDRQVDRLAAEGPEGAAAEAYVRKFLLAGQVGRLRALQAGHPDERVRQALAKLLPPASAPNGGAAR